MFSHHEQFTLKTHRLETFFSFCSIALNNSGPRKGIWEHSRKKIYQCSSLNGLYALEKLEIVLKFFLLTKPFILAVLGASISLFRNTCEF